MPSNWKDKAVTVLGLGKTGYSVAKYLALRQASVIVSENRQLSDEDKALCKELEDLDVEIESGGHSKKALSECSLVVTSPGIKPSSDVMRELASLGKPVICDVEFAFNETETPIVAITGTNGKSTTTALISFILQESGFKAPACGNFGVPVLEALENKPDYLVIEVSSYQLFYCQKFAPLVGIWINLTPDHIDWHGSKEEYIAAKQKMFSNMGQNNWAVLNLDDPVVASVKSRAQKFPFSLKDKPENLAQFSHLAGDSIVYTYKGQSHTVCRADELKIIGRHNLENVLAAVNASAILGLDAKVIGEGLKKFGGLAHRLEFVSTINGIQFFNDSKATNPESTIKALEAFKEKVVLIAGGKDKGTGLDEMVDSVRKHAIAVILLGEAKGRFKQALVSGGVKDIYEVCTMEEAVELGLKLNLGPVLLSPACASFDMFKNFEDRGNVFKDIVQTRDKRASVAKAQR